jgi:hypothetical protein
MGTLNWDFSVVLAIFIALHCQETEKLCKPVKNGNWITLKHGFIENFSALVSIE